MKKEELRCSLVPVRAHAGVQHSAHIHNAVALWAAHAQLGVSILQGDGGSSCGSFAGELSSLKRCRKTLMHGLNIICPHQGGQNQPCRSAQFPQQQAATCKLKKTKGRPWNLSIGPSAHATCNSRVAFPKSLFSK